MNDIHKLRKRQAHVLSSLRLDHPFDVTKLCDQIAAQRQRALVLHELTATSELPCGLRIGTADGVDHVYFAATRSATHRDQIIVRRSGR